MILGLWSLQLRWSFFSWKDAWLMRIIWWMNGQVANQGFCWPAPWYNCTVCKSSVEKHVNKIFVHTTNVLLIQSLIESVIVNYISCTLSCIFLLLRCCGWSSAAHEQLKHWQDQNTSLFHFQFICVLESCHLDHQRLPQRLDYACQGVSALKKYLLISLEFWVTIHPHSTQVSPCTALHATVLHLVLALWMQQSSSGFHTQRITSTNCNFSSNQQGNSPLNKWERDSGGTNNLHVGGLFQLTSLTPWFIGTKPAIFFQTDLTGKDGRVEAKKSRSATCMI